MKKGINVLSLFDGISNGYLALERVGIKINKYYSSEIDVTAIQISNDNISGIIRLGDVKGWRNWNLDEIDLIIGGSPCQGFSNQGVGLNFEDPRSALFFEFVNILNYYKPKYFLLENVVMKKEWESVINEYLGCEPFKINSSLLAPQNRPRLYWTNINFDEIKQKEYKLIDYLENVNLEDYTEKDGIKICKSFSDNAVNLVSFENGEIRIKQGVKKGYIEAEKGDGVNLSFALSTKRRGRVLKNKSSCLDTVCNFGVLDEKNQIRRFTIKELERLQTLPEGYTKSVGKKEAIKAIGNGWTVDIIAHIFKGIK